VPASLGATPPDSGHCRKARRRSGLHNRFVSVAAIAAGLILAAAIICVVTQRFLPSLPTPISELGRAPDPPENQPRKIYPYSVIPGGIANGEELQSKLKMDKTAARHYSDFQVNRGVLVYARFDRQSAYVSYRIGNRIFWTRKRVRVDPTEILLTDGTYFARTRCGNRLSDTPQKPTAEEEPTEEALLYTPPPISNKLIRFPTEFSDAPPLATVKNILELPKVDFIAALDQPSKPSFLLASGPTYGIAKTRVATENVPEPVSIILLVSGSLLLGFVRFRAKKSFGPCGR